MTNKYWQAVKDLADMLNISKRPDYHVNKWIFRLALLAIFGMAAWCVHLDGWGILTNKVWTNYECNETTKLCPPGVPGEPMMIYKDGKVIFTEDALDQIPSGQLLEKVPSFQTRYFRWFAIFIFGLALIVNKLAYNRGRKLLDLEEIRQGLMMDSDKK